MSKTKTLSESLRQAIADSGMTRYEICKLAGVEQAALSRFWNGQRGLTLESADKLARTLRLELVKKEGK